MIITGDLLDEIVPIEMMPTRLDSAMNLYTSVNLNGSKGIILYNINPNTWNCLYSFYELNHKFTIDNYQFGKENMTYGELIEEYKKVYKEFYEQEKGNIKEKRIETLSNEFIKTFNLNGVTIKDELTPIFELKFSKSKNVWTLYYFENYVASDVNSLDRLIHQELYEQKILPLDSNEKSIDGIEIVTNIQYLLSIEENIDKLKKNALEPIMEKFYFEVPSIDRKKDAIDFINEFYAYNSRINGVGGLDRYLDNYEGWLEKLEVDYTRQPNKEKVPARTYFLVRKNDKKIIGMINIRLTLNEKLKKYGGHIGFGIRPTERGKGYNKINLYLGLKVCNEYGIDKVFMDADLDNLASWKTMEALGGKRVRQYFEDEIAHCEVVCYSIDVKKALEKYSFFEKYILDDKY